MTNLLELVRSFGGVSVLVGVVFLQRGMLISIRVSCKSNQLGRDGKGNLAAQGRATAVKGHKESRISLTIANFLYAFLISCSVAV
jgi:hypothetical protein